MADLSVAISNSINCFGPAPTTKWGTGTPYNMTWGTSNWGEGTEDLQVAAEKLLTESLTIDGGTLSFDVIKVYDGGSVTLSSETTSETLQTANGYYYLFVLPTSEAESRNLSTYTEGSDPSTTYTSSTASSPTWS